MVLLELRIVTGICMSLPQRGLANQKVIKGHFHGLAFCKCSQIEDLVLYNIFRFSLLHPIPRTKGLPYSAKFLPCVSIMRKGKSCTMGMLSFFVLLCARLPKRGVGGLSSVSHLTMKECLCILVYTDLNLPKYWTISNEAAKQQPSMKYSVNFLTSDMHSA